MNACGEFFQVYVYLGKQSPPGWQIGTTEAGSLGWKPSDVSLRMIRIEEVFSLAFCIFRMRQLTDRLLGVAVVPMTN